MDDNSKAVTVQQNNDSVKEAGATETNLKANVERNERAEWGKGIEFLMSCIAMSVGLGNIWRFPFTAYQNGGGAFLIPYVIVLIVIGRPIYYLEMSLGQFSSKGNVKMFQALAPVMKGIGYGQLIGCVCVATYYCSLVSLTLFYLLNSFTSNLPWSVCRQEWEDENTLNNITCIPSGETNVTVKNGISSSELYFRREVLKEKSQILDGVGYPEWRLLLCSLFSWFALFIITRKGIRSSGKAAYFLAIFPYVIMLALLFRAVTLEGADDGMLYFIKPNWGKLAEAQVWYAAVTQCFFSLNVGFGTITMFASYNNFKQNIYRDCLIVTTLDTFTSLLSGTTIFGILGHLAFKLNVDVSEVINAGGTGLAFISYPEAIAKFDAVPWLFAILFFFMLFVLGLGSMVGLQGVAMTVIMDSIPSLKAWTVSLGTVVAGFLIGLVFITPGGQFIFTIVDYFGGTMIFFVLIIFETTLIFWWYGLENICEDFEFMLKRKVGVYWRISWGIINPVILIVIFVYFIFTIQRLQHENRYIPDVALACGWLIVGVGTLQIIQWWLYYLYHVRKIGLIESLKSSLSHSKWGPHIPENYRGWKQEKQDILLLKSQTKLGWFKHKCFVLIGKKYY